MVDSAPTGRDEVPPLLRAATWVSITALVVAAIICVVWVLLGRDDDVVVKALLTVVLLAGFAGVAIMEARLASRRPEWFVLTSMVTWVIILVIGALFIWMPIVGAEVFFTVSMRILRYAAVIAVIALGLQDVRLYLREHRRYVTPFTAAVAHVTVGLVAVLVLMLVIPLVIGEYVDFSQFYWRLAVAVAILAAVGTSLLPLVRALFNPRPVRPPRRTRAWPTYPDGVTPLPVTKDGSPDWDAYHLARQAGQGGQGRGGQRQGGWGGQGDQRGQAGHAPGAPGRPPAIAGWQVPTVPTPTAVAPTAGGGATDPARTSATGGSGSAPSASASSASAVAPRPARPGTSETPAPRPASSAPSPARSAASAASTTSPSVGSVPPPAEAAAARPDTSGTSSAPPASASGGSTAHTVSIPASISSVPAERRRTERQASDAVPTAAAAPAATPPVSARTVIADSRAATGPAPAASIVLSPLYSRTLDAIPPRPPLPTRASTSVAVAATAAEPLPARSHGWWGGHSSADGAEPAMRWAEDPRDWPAVSLRRSGVRRRAES